MVSHYAEGTGGRRLANRSWRSRTAPSSRDLTQARIEILSMRRGRNRHRTRYGGPHLAGYADVKLGARPPAHVSGPGRRQMIPRSAWRSRIDQRGPAGHQPAHLRLATPSLAPYAPTVTVLISHGA
jgi:hypothetical protein